MEGEDFETGPYPETPVSPLFPLPSFTVNLHIIMRKKTQNAFLTLSNLLRIRDLLLLLLYHELELEAFSRNESVLAEFQEWSEEEQEEDDSQRPISREDSGIQLDRTPQDDRDTSNKKIPVTWTGANWFNK